MLTASGTEIFSMVSLKFELFLATSRFHCHRSKSIVCFWASVKFLHDVGYVLHTFHFKKWVHVLKKRTPLGCEIEDLVEARIFNLTLIFRSHVLLCKYTGFYDLTGC